MTNRPDAGPQPPNEWASDCMLWRKRILTGSKAHWCSDWDGLPVDETTPEFECCTCFVGAPTMTASPAANTMESGVEREAEALLMALGLTYTQASVCETATGWLVLIWRRCKRPALREWAGKPVEYRTGGGVPRALGAAV